MPVSEPCIVVRLDESELHVCVGIPNAILLLAQARPRTIQHLSSTRLRVILLAAEQLLLFVASTVGLGILQKKNSH